MNKQRIGDLITQEEVENWKQGSIITINAGTGAGKSYFVKNTLYDYAKEHDQKILILVNRNRLRDQYIEEINRDNKSDVIKVFNYQVFENKLLYEEKLNFQEYAFIVCDEYHYAFVDANFNNKTDLFLNYILQQNITRLFLSATSVCIKDYITNFIKSFNQKLNLTIPIVEYSIPQDYSFIESLNFYDDKETAINLISRITQNNPEERIIYFSHSAKIAYEAYKEFESKAIFNCSDGNREYSKYIDRKKISDLLKEEKFNEQLLVTTTALDNGVNIVDKSVKHIILDIEDVDVLIQCLGRKRIINDTDKVNIYIKNFTKTIASRRLRKANKLLVAANYFMDYGFIEFVIKYPRQVEYSKIIFDIPFASDGKYKNKRVNYIMYYKYQQDSLFYNEVLLHKDAYKNKICRIFNIEDYKIIEKEEVKTELEIYLDSLIGKRLYKEDQMELIKCVNLRKDGKLLKSYSSLNCCFDELQIDYSIKSHKDYKRKLEDGNINPNYKLTYWNIIHA